MDNVDSISIIGHLVTAHKTDGSLWYWGSNDYTRLECVPTKLMDGVLAYYLVYLDFGLVVMTDGSLWEYNCGDEEFLVQIKLP